MDCLNQARFNFHLNHLPHQPPGLGTRGPWSLSRAVTLWSCLLSPLCRDGLVCRRTGVHRVWLPSQAPLLPPLQVKPGKSVRLRRNEWLIIYLGFPTSLTVENLICLSIENNLNILFLSFLSVWGEWVCEIYLGYIKQSFFFTCFSVEQIEA